MLSFLKNKLTSHSIAVFAIDTGSVTLTVLEIISPSENKIVFIDRRALDTDPNDTPKDTLRKITNKIEEIFHDLVIRKSIHLVSGSRSFVLLGSSWNVSWKDTIVVKQEKAFRLTSDFMKSAIDERFKVEHKGLSIISSHVMSVSMNGYKIKNCIGKLTPSVEFDVFVESAPSEALSQISDAIEKHIPHSQIRFSTISYASVEAIIKSTKVTNFVLVLPENDLTEIAIVRDGSISTTASIPFGSATVARDLFGKLKDKEAYSRTKRFIEGNLEVNLLSKISKPLEEVRKKFLLDFNNVLFSMNDSVLCPNILFVGGKSPAAFFINDWIVKNDYGSQTFTADCFKISSLTGTDILNKKSFSGKSLPFVSAVSAIAANSFASTFEIDTNKIK